MEQNKQPSARSFRLTTRKKFSIRSKTQDNDDSSSEARSEFSTQYHSLTKKLKIKSLNYLTNNKMGSTISSFDLNPSFRIRTQSSFSKNLNDKAQAAVSYMPLFSEGSNDLKNSLSFRGQTNMAKRSIKFNLGSYTKNKKHYKIQRPSLYCDFEQEPDPISPFKHTNKLKKQEQLKVNSSSSKQRGKLLQNWILLWKIRKQFTQNNNKIRPKEVMKAVKLYIMRKQERNESAKGMESLLLKQEDQVDFKQLLTYQRCLIIGIVELFRIQKLHSLCVEYVSILNNLMGFYKHFLGLIFTFSGLQFKFFSSNIKDYEALKKQIELEDIEQKTSLTSTLLFMCTKLNTVFRFSPDLLKKIKTVINNAKKASINRSFYDLLTCLAVYLNQKELERPQMSKINKYMLSFMTCPSPYIVQPRINKNYSLVLDLDETLVNTKLDDTAGRSKYSVNYRPYCLQFVSNLAQFYEIIIFTSSVSRYAQQVISKFQSHVSHMLCRQHTILVKGVNIKDLSKIGRPIETTIIVDNMSHNFRLQSQNGIEIKSWYGDKNDRELEKMQKILLKVIEKDPKDIRQALKEVLG